MHCFELRKFLTLGGLKHLYKFMVLEAIISPKTARQKPWIIVILAFAFVSIGILAADFLGIYKSIITITLVSIPAVPFIWKLFDFEEAETEQSVVLGSRTVARHLPVILVMSMFFIGLIAGFVFWFFALPVDKNAEIFEVQINELKAISSNPSGQLLLSINDERFAEVFEMLFFHNLGVLLIILLFSLLYGAGAVFVFTWNASIIATFIGNYAKAVGAASITGLIAGIGTGALSLAPHGTFELLSYLVAALAGGILSSAITREVHKTNSFMLVMHDSLKLTAVSVILLAIAGFIEAGAIVG